jgi:hypothetical protein
MSCERICSCSPFVRSLTTLIGKFKTFKHSLENFQILVPNKPRGFKVINLSIFRECPEREDEIIASLLEDIGIMCFP